MKRGLQADVVPASPCHSIINAQQWLDVSGRALQSHLDICLATKTLPVSFEPVPELESTRHLIGRDTVSGTAAGPSLQCYRCITMHISLD